MVGRYNSSNTWQQRRPRKETIGRSEQARKSGYRASKKKSEFFMKQTKWLGHEIDKNGIKPNEEKVEAILKLNPPVNTKELKSFLGAIQYMAKCLPMLSERTDRLRKFLKKNETWN